MSEVLAAFLLDLDYEKPAAAPEDQVELVASSVGVRVEQPVAAKPIVAESTAFAAIHAAS
jgi:hypothetical protein